MSDHQNTEGQGPTCRWCGHVFIHAEYHTQHEPMCIDRPSLQSAVTMWRAVDPRAEVVAEMEEQIPEFATDEFRERWRVAIGVLRAAVTP